MTLENKLNRALKSNDINKIHEVCNNDKQSWD